MKHKSALDLIRRPDRLTLGIELPLDNDWSPAGETRRVAAGRPRGVPDLSAQTDLVRKVDDLGFTAIWMRDVPVFDAANMGDAGSIHDVFALLSEEDGYRNAAQASSANIRTDDTFVYGRRDETIPIVDENLRVRKRDVNSGSVRVRAYTVENPVNEQLSLREENVSVERRPVDRPLTDADRAFQDRMISAEEHHEEAVVSKEARVVEEIGIRKTAADRTETINDTVRKTEVEIEDQRIGQQSQNGLGQNQSQGFRRD